MISGWYPWPEEEAERYKKKRWWAGMTWGDYLDRAADLYGPKLAVVDAWQSLTWSELRDRVDRTAWALTKLGIKKDDRVILQISNRAEYIFCKIALNRIGAVEVQCVPAHGEITIKHMCHLTEPVAWILDEPNPKFNRAAFIQNIREDYPALQHVIMVGDVVHQGTLSFNALLDEVDPTQYSAEYWEKVKPDPSEVYMIGLTGGTTGISKGVPQTPNNHFLDGYTWGKGLGVTCNDVALIVTPIAHNLSSVVILMTMLLEGGTLVISPTTEPEQILTLIERHKVAWTFMVPAVVIRILDHPNLDKFDISSLRFIGTGGSHMPPDVVRAVMKRLGCDFRNSFGSIEGISAITRPWDTFEAKCNTTGHKMCPWNEIKFVDDEGREVPPGEEGELCGKGPTVIRGYYKTDNREVLTPDGFFRMGDLGMFDKEGRLIITGRKKDVINRGGEKVSATEIEDALRLMPKVSDACVVAMPHRVLGEDICAYVIPEKDVLISLEEIKNFLREKGFPPNMLPARLELIDEFPMTPIGKVNKRVLRDLIKQKV